MGVLRGDGRCRAGSGTAVSAFRLLLAPAVSFLNPLFLLALGAAAIPVVLHLVRKVQARRVPFGSLRFLTVAPRERVRRRRLKDVGLMAMRMAILALLTLAFARPFFPPEALPFLPQRADRSVVLLVDRSYSMQAGEAFAQAQAEVQRRLDALQGDDEAAIVAFDDGVEVLSDLTDDRTLLRSVAAGALAAGYRPTDLFPAFQRAEALLQDARHAAREIVLISDLQRIGWTGAFDNWKLAHGITLTVVPVGGGMAGNAFVEAVHVEPERVGARTVVRFDARVQARGEAVRPRDVTLTVGEMPVGTQRLAPVAAARVTFQQEAARTGSFLGVLALDPDPLEVDNRYYVAYQVAERPSLLVVDGEAQNPRRDAFFLQSAFDLGETARYRVAVASPRRLTPGALRDHDVVFVANVPALEGDRLEALRAYLDGGGRVILSFGEAVDVRAYDAALQALGVGQVGPEVDARRVQGHPAIIGEVERRHPIFAPFDGSSAGAILRPQFRRYVRLVPDSAAVVLGRYDTGDPFLLERDVGQGRLLVYTSTFGTAWTDFPVNEWYVPFVYQLVRYLQREGTVRQQYTVGEIVGLGGRPGEVWEIQAPGNRLFRATVDEQGRAFFRETDVPGHYAARKGAERFVFAVNVDPREAEPDVRDAEEAYAAVVPPSDEVPRAPDRAARSAEAEEAPRRRLWMGLLLAALALFAAESFWANRPARTKRRLDGIA